MTLKSFNFLFVILYFKLVYSTNLNYLYPDILKSENDLTETEKIVSQFVRDSKFGEESNKFQEGIYNYSQITDKDNFLDDYKNDTHTNMVKSFYLYTRDYHDGKDPEVLYPFNSSSLNNSHLKQKPIYILIHGFGGNGSVEWIIKLKDELLKKEDYNIISFDWPGGKRTGNAAIDNLFFIRAMSRLPNVGNEASVFIESLIKQVDLTLNSVHCIGFSLGAHACGFMGKPLKGRVGRITALNPTDLSSYNTYDLLDKSDAVYLDVIFTDACKSSYCNINGHSTFFPNGGMSQPGCPVLYKDYTRCSSSMAYKYFIASINSKQPSTYFLSRPCENWQQYKSGNCSCGESLQIMGFYAKAELHGSFYLETLAKPPYTIQDTDCVIPNSIFQSSIVEIVSFVGMAILIVALIFYIVFQRCYNSPANNEEKPLLDNRKATRSTCVV